MAACSTGSMASSLSLSSRPSLSYRGSREA
jgi:hypothetical protein